MKKSLLFLAAVLLLWASPSRADIYRWEDDTGAIHFTDDLSNVPAKYRSKAKTVIREAPAPAEAPAPPAAQPPPQAAPTPPPAEPSAADIAREKDELASQVAAMKAKIDAKQKLIKYVEDKQSLTGNPYRNRIVDPPDQELYQKYQAELPKDLEELRALESRLERLK